MNMRPRPLAYIGGVAAVALLLAWVLTREPATTSHTPVEAPTGGGDARAAPDRAAASPAEPVASALWQAVEPRTVEAARLPAYKEVVEGRALVRLLAPQRPFAVGDRPALPIPQLGETYHALVERVEVGPGSTRSVAGHASIDSGRHLFVYTVGPRSTFARIGTPHGTFELVANGELGWLMPTANMDRHVDYTKPDSFIVRPGADRIARPVAANRLGDVAL